MREVLFGHNELPLKHISKSDVEIYDVPGNGDCFYSAVLGLYSVTVGFPLGMELQDRMNAMQAQYWSSTTFRARPHHLRMLFAKYLYKNWEHYYTNDVFQERLLSVARLGSPHLLVQYTSNQIRDAYIDRMTSRQEWAGNVECDIASELFGMKIEVYAIIEPYPDLLSRNNTFEPYIHPPVRREMTAWKWALLQDNNNHFKYIQPTLGTMDNVSAENRLVARVDEIDPDAINAIRRLARTRRRMPFEAFRAWFRRHFISLDRAVVQLALHLFFATYVYYLATRDNAQSGHALEDMGPPLPLSTSVVDEIFDKHNAQKRVTGAQTKGRACVGE